MAARRRIQVGTTIAVSVLVAVIGPTRAQAQTPPSSTVNVRSVFSVGERVVITTPSGVERGKVFAVWQDSVDLLDGKKKISLTYSDIRRVDQSYGDPHHTALKRGLLFGLAGGAGFGALGAASSCSKGGFIDFCSGSGFSILMLWSGAYGAGIGAGVGLLMEAARSGKKQIWPVPSGAVTSVTPLFAPHGGGARITVRW